jgi:uncharacterized membrane protein YphA (DoxX/SURF4 family)
MTQDDKGRKIAYWVATGILVAVFVAAGIQNMIPTPGMLAMLDSLGYPPYLAHILGVAKLLAVVAILTPGFQRLKEWAYAGVTIDLLGAAWSHAASGHSFMDIATPLLVLAFAWASWLLRPANRKLPDAAGDCAALIRPPAPLSRESAFGT